MRIHLRRLPSLAVLLLVLGLAAHARAGESTPVNTRCPVMPEEVVDPAITVEVEGKTIAFCCLRCRKEFLENPGIYLASIPGIDTGEGSAGHAHGSEEGGEEAGDGAGHSTSEDGAHDHGSHGAGRLVRFLGKFHPLTVHFPIALAMAAALAEALLLLTRRDVFGQAGRFCVVLAGLGAVAAASLGWAAGWGATYPGDLAETLILHRWLGTGAAALLLLVVGLSELHRREGMQRLQLAYRISLFAAVPLVGLTAHLGGTLIFGTDHFTW